MTPRSRCLLCALVFALLVVTPSVNAQPQTAEAPILKPGENWTWKWSDDFRGGASHNGTKTRTVVRLDKFEGQDVYVLARGDGTFDVWNYDLGILGTIDGTGTVKYRRVRKGDNQFPLSIGKSVTLQIDNPERKVRGQTKFTVKGNEEVSTSGGTFAAFAVAWEFRGTLYDGTPLTAPGTDYYAPAAKAWVKSSFSTNTGYHYSEELVSYQVVP